MRFALIIFLVVVIGNVFYFVNYQKNEMKIPVATNPINVPPSLSQNKKSDERRVRAPASVVNEKTLSDDDYYIGRGSGTEIYKNLSPEEKASVVATLEVEIRRDSEYIDYLRETGTNPKVTAEEIGELEKKLEEKRNILDELTTGSQ